MASDPVASSLLQQDTTAALPVAAAPAASSRLLSVDALRGFAMFWLVGGRAVVLAVVALTGWEWLKSYADEQLKHPPWHGFVWWDLVMPLFMTVSGVTIPLSVTRRLQRGESKWVLYGRLSRRLLLLMMLNVISYGALNHYDWRQTHFLGVLTRIGLAYFFASVIVMHLSPRRQLLWTAGILLGYSAAMLLIPVPGIGRGLLTPEGNLAAFMDRNLVPGVLRGGMYDRLGLFSTLPAICTVLIGALAGECLLSTHKPWQKVATLLAAGAACWMLAHVIAVVLPFNTKFWSPSYVLVAAGWSMVLLAAFFLVIDIWGLKRWAFFFAVIGLNSITIYFAQYPVNFDKIGHFLLNGVVAMAGAAMRPLLFAAGVLAIKWLLLYFLYRRRIFLRV